MDGDAASVASQSPRQLKGRQRDCMLLVMKGFTSKQIARKLGISPRTVDQHIAAAIEALGVSSRLGAISLLYDLEREETSASPEEPFLLAKGSNGPEKLLIENEEFEKSPVLPSVGGVKNSAERKQRILWITEIAVFSVMLSCFAIISILAVYQFGD